MDGVEWVEWVEWVALAEASGVEVGEPGRSSDMC